MNCRTCAVVMTGRKRKYCQPSCRPTYYSPKNAGLENCQVCQKPLATIGTPGRPKRNCSRKCRNRSRAIRLRKTQVEKCCEVCNSLFTTSKKDSRFCKADCRLAHNKQKSRLQHKAKMESLYPNGLRTVQCGWCNEPRTFNISESTPNAYHEDCTKEAQSARYRIKTVKRQKKTNPYRISHEQVVREHGSNCDICKEPIDLSLPRTNRFGLTVDHVIPVSKGGTDDMSNLRPAHWICNIRKSDKMPESDNA